MSIARETSRFGLLTVNDEDILTFPRGIPGFETHYQWILAGEDDSPIKWLQSLADGDVALPVADPRIIRADYNARISEGDLVQLKAEETVDLALLLVLSIPAASAWDMTANLRAPLVIKHKKRICAQVIASNEEYEVRAFVLGEGMRKSMGRKAAAEATPPAAAGA